jgi:hypothetical protein
MIFCASPSLVALNDSNEWFERAVVLGDLIEQGDVVVVYQDDLFCGFLGNTNRLPMLAAAES